MSDLDIQIGLRLRYYRKQKRLSVDELAQRLSKKATTIYKYEKGLISIDVNTLYQLADILGISYFQLLELPDSNENNLQNNIDISSGPSSRLYCYHYDGRHGRIIHSNIYIYADDFTEKKTAILHYDVHDDQGYKHYQYLYYGTVTMFDYIIYFNFNNKTNSAEFMNIVAFNPWHHTKYAWGMLCGILDHPITPASCKILTSPTPIPQEELTPEKLSFNKTELARLRNTNIFSLSNQ